MDNSGRIKGRVSLVDIFLVVAFIALVAGFVHRQASGRLGDILRPSTPIELVIRGEGLRHFITDSVSVGDVMFRQHDRTAIGTVTNVEVTPFVNYLHRSDGTAELVVSEARYAIYVTLDTIGTVTERGFFINGLDHMALGGHISLVSNRVIIPDGRVFSVVQKEE